MKAFKKIMIMVFSLLIPFLLQAAEFQVKVIKSEDDLPEKSCSHWEKGDFLIFDGKNLTLIGGAKRPLLFIKGKNAYFPSSQLNEKQ